MQALTHATEDIPYSFAQRQPFQSADSGQIDSIQTAYFSKPENARSSARFAQNGLIFARNRAFVRERAAPPGYLEGRGHIAAQASRMPVLSLVSDENSCKRLHYSEGDDVILSPLAE